MNHTTPATPAIALVTTCKGRLHHIRQTLPLMVAEAPDEVVVVDYGCPDHVGDWVAAHFPQVKVVRIDDDPGFCLPRARNAGAGATRAEWICFVDADVRIAPGWLAWLRKALRPDAFFLRDRVQGSFVLETVGTVCCSRAAWEGVGGYDEAYRGWGGEDTDLYHRLEAAGCRRAYYPAQFVEPLPHDDSERVAYHDVKSRKMQSVINKYYARINRHIASVYGRQAPTPLRQAIMQQIKAQFLDQANAGKLYPAVEVVIGTQGLLPEASPYRSIRFSLVRKKRFFGLGKYKWYLRHAPEAEPAARDR